MQTCQIFIRASLPYFVMCQGFLRAIVPMCHTLLYANMLKLFTCQGALHRCHICYLQEFRSFINANVSYFVMGQHVKAFYVPMYLYAILCYIPTCQSFICASMPSCYLFLRANNRHMNSANKFILYLNLERSDILLFHQI